MSIDLTGINNVNDFYTSHYLATYFEENVREAQALWKDAEEAGGAENPASALKGAANLFYRLLPEYERESNSAEQVNAVREMAGAVLEALGYSSANNVEVSIDADIDHGIFHEECDAQGRPSLWVILANNKDAETDALGSPALLEYEPSPDNETFDNETLVSRLFFDVAEPPRFIILMSMTEAVLLDRNKWSEKRCIIFDLKTIFARKEDTTLRAMATLLARTSTCPEEGDLLLDQIDKRSRDNAAAVSDKLKYALRESIELLGNEVIYDWVHNKGHNLDDDPIDEGELTIECLRYMYRMLFLLFIEARPELGFAPMKSDVYARAYSLESLREIEESIRESLDVERDSNYLDQTLDALCQRVYNGYPEDEAQYRGLLESGSSHDVFIMPPLKAHIFDAQRTPYITNARLRDSVLLRIVDLMSISKASNRRERAERISYGTLGINQLGAVYEALLSYRGFIAKETLFEVKRAGDAFDPLEVGYFVTEVELENYTEDERARLDNGDLRTYKKGTFVYRLAGREREKSASYYTPECLTQCLVKYALKELLQDKTADEILELTICEPAMGSAAFLNEAVSQLAEAYLEKRQEELGESIPYDERELEYQRVKMFIADRNIYGIDLNPIAVELAEVSLWLNSISQDGFVPWFGNQLHNGNSLIGARRRGYTERMLTSNAAGIRWYDNEPDRIGYETGCSKSHRVYHFLVSDPGMSLYKDKAIKELEPELVKKISDWNKKLKVPYTREEVESLRHLSLVVDRLWEKQIDQQRAMRMQTQDALTIYGCDKNSPFQKTSIRQKDRIYAQFYLSEHERNAGPFARLKFAMDYWCALWFWPIEEADELPSRDEFLMDMTIILEGTVADVVGVRNTAVTQTQILFEEEDLNTPEQLQIAELQEAYGLENEVDLDKLCERFRRFALVREIAGKQHFFHWELEFADVFEDRGGFDLIIGNPPWVKLEWNEQAVLSDVDPRFAVKELSASDTKVSPWRMSALAVDSICRSYLDEYVTMTATKTFLNATQNYPLLKGQQTNLYRCFLPQAWAYCSEQGVSAFVHPDGILVDANAGMMRMEMLRRYRCHFQFENEHNLFKGTNDHGRMRFSLNVYASEQHEPDFISINNLFEPKTIEECFVSGAAGIVPGIKDNEGNWETKGHPNRAIKIAKRELSAFSQLLADNDWRCARVLNVHARLLMDVLETIAMQPLTLRDDSIYVFSSQCWHETGARRAGTIDDAIAFPESSRETILSGAHIGTSNPLFQVTRAIYSSPNDYDVIDLETIGERYFVRTKYRRSLPRAEYEALIPKMDGELPFDLYYRIVFRDMVGCSSERSLQAAIVPPGQMWIHKLLGAYVSTSEPWINKNRTSKYRLLAWVAGCMASLPMDYAIRAIGKGDLTVDNIYMIPVIDTPLFDEVVCRALLLNCLTRDYAVLWADCWDDEFVDFSWSKPDARLPQSTFSDLTDAWEWSTPLRRDYERRQALVELDVLVSLALGLTLEQLETVYRLDFSVLQSYENDTWYDRNGRIAFSKKNLGASKPARQEFEAKRDAGQDIEVTYTDNTLPGGPRERTVRYEAPYDMCDRIEDYRTAWRFFSDKYGLGDA